jgi:c-di-GMP-binding flagellar brake protein YcgR
MKPITAVESEVRDNVLAEAAARNLPADLMLVRGENLQANLKSRFLLYEPERVLLEVPRHNGRPVLLQPGQFVEVYFKVNHDRFGFDSRAVGHCRIDLNRGTTVEAVRVAPPRFLERRQRRKFYRVSVASLPTIEARLWPIDADSKRSLPIMARLCNLSAGGVAILTGADTAQRFVREKEYRLKFRLPDDLEEPFEFYTVVCHVRDVFRGRRQIVGLAFMPGEGTSHHGQAIERIARFVAAQQREQLFRARRQKRRS